MAKWTIVWIANFVVPNPFPREFMQLACPYRFPGGRSCAKSLEFGPHCSHNLPGTSQYRFQVICLDAIYPGLPPLHVNLWDLAIVLLGCTAASVRSCFETEQLAYVTAIMESTPRVKIHCWSFDKGVFAMHLTLLDAAKVALPDMLRGLSTPEQPSPSTPTKAMKTTPRKGSAKQLLEDLCKAIQSAEIEDND